MKLFVTTLSFLLSFAVTAADSCSKDVAPLLDTLFASLGHDCSTYGALFTDDAKYFHQHDGFKNGSQLADNCKSYAAFCPGNNCKFLQNGGAVKVARGGSCHVLVPYLWSELPANKENLEPHTGWEYLVATPSRQARFGYRIQRFAEIESSYSVAFNWAQPDQTPALVAESTLRLLALKNSASKGECDSPLAPTLTKYFADRTRNGNAYRQQGDAIVLAAGGVCQVAVPYAAQVGDQLKTGQFVFTLQPASGSYSISDVVEFASQR